MAHVGASAAVHDPVAMGVEGRERRDYITDKVGGNGCQVEQIQ